MFGKKRPHLEHVNFLLPFEDRLELVVAKYLPLVRRVLQLLFLDVLPELLRRVEAGEGLDGEREGGGGGEGRHEVGEGGAYAEHLGGVGERNKDKTGSGE